MAAPVVESSSHTTYASRTNTTITAPSGIQDGDFLLLIQITALSSEAPDPTPPAGFVSLPGSWPTDVTVSSFNVEMRAWSKFAFGESGDYTVTHATCSSQGAVIRISGVDANAFDPNPTLNTGTGTTTTFTGLTTSVADTLVLVLGHDWGDTTNDIAPPSGSTPTFAEIIDSPGAAGLLYAAAGALASPGATGNKTIANNNTNAPNGWAGVMVALVPGTPPPPPPVVFVGAGAVAFGSAAGTTVAPSIPTHQAGDLLVAIRAMKHSTSQALTAESGWTRSVAEQTGGAGSFAADTGPTKICIDALEATGAGTTVTFDNTATTNTVAWAQVIVLRKTDPAATWDLAGVSGTDNTTGAAYSVAFSSNPGFETGDFAVIGVSTPTDVTAAHWSTTVSLTATGLTATVTERGDAVSANGNDIGAGTWTAEITAGPSTGNPTFAATASGTTTNIAGPCALLRVRAVASGQSAAIGPAGETDTAPALGRAKTRTLGPAVETDTTATLGRSKTLAIGAAIETNTAPPLGRVKARPVAAAVESDTAPVVQVRPIRITVNPALETDTAPALARAKADAIGPATETDTAAALARAKAETITAAVETDTAATLGRSKARQIGPAAETNTAPAVTHTKRAALGPALETDTAPPVATPAGGTLGPAAETNTAPALWRAKTDTIGPAAESDTAPPLARRKTRPVAPALESDAAGTLTRQKTRLLSPGIEIDTAAALGQQVAVAIDPALETDTASPVARAKRDTINPALETDTAPALTRVKARLLNAANEVNLARPIGHARTRQIGPALELDTAPAIDTPGMQVLVGAAHELDTAPPLVQQVGLVGRLEPVAGSGQRLEPRQPGASRLEPVTGAGRRLEPGA